ncbi:MAG: S41 family peptidase, partial [Tumebacillaceae bacterium]
MQTALDFRLTTGLCHEVISSLAQKMRDIYLLPEIGQLVHDTVLQRLADRQFDSFFSSEEFVKAVNELLQELTHDKHVIFRYSEEKLPPFEKAFNSAEMTERRRKLAIRQNFGFHKIERLAGNIGYIDVRSFHLPDWAGETLAAAMNALVHTDALIIDLRQHGGGYAFMSALFASYFLGPDPIRLSNLYNQAGECVRQIWSHSYVQGERYKEDKPV